MSGKEKTAWWRSESRDRELMQRLRGDAPYRGVDNAKAKRSTLSRARPVKLVPREEVATEHRPPLLPGRKSRRRRMHVWIPS